MPTIIAISGSLRVEVAGAGKVFDAGGAIVDDTVRGLLATYMTGFARFVAKHRIVL